MSKQGNHTVDEIELPLRAVVDYLAGRIDRAAFELAVPGQWLEGLRRRLDRGAGVSDISINRSLEEDDDGLLFTFREHDAAAAPFRGPSWRVL